MQLYEFKLKNAMQNICDITARLHGAVVDKEKSEEILNCCTEQEFRVIQVLKTVNSYLYKLMKSHTD